MHELGLQARPEMFQGQLLNLWQLDEKLTTHKEVGQRSSLSFSLLVVARIFINIALSLDWFVKSPEVLDRERRNKSVVELGDVVDNSDRGFVVSLGQEEPADQDEKGMISTSERATWS
jgi:hypothetical protein